MKKPENKENDFYTVLKACAFGLLLGVMCGVVLSSCEEVVALVKVVNLVFESNSPSSKQNSDRP
jgi:hypothetical protein